jgi:hypothetical protein
MRRKDELWHYGVKGMKWGVRRYQPYPKGHRGGQFLGVDKKTNQQKQGYVDPRLILFGVGALAEITAFAVAATASAVGTKKAKKFEALCDREREKAPVEKKSGLKRQVETKTDAENIKRVNPGYNNSDATGTHNNCVNCTMAAELRMRGYEVQAKRKSDGRVGTEVGKKYFKNVKTVEVQKAPKFTKDDYDEVLRFFDREEAKTLAFGGNRELANKSVAAIKKFPPGARGQVTVSWNRRGGHSMLFKVGPNGEAFIYDGQTGKVLNERETYKVFTRACTCELQRFDNCDVNFKAIKEGVR